MKKLVSIVFAACVAAAGTHAFAADDMKKDGMMKKGEMKKEGMKKDGMMKKDSMKKDGMMKKDEMKK